MPFLFPNKLLNEGMRSAVSCQILEGSLPITFRWNKDGQPLGASAAIQNGLFATPPLMLDGVVIRSNDEYSSTLIIDNLKFQHRGNYTCEAINAAGSARHSAELTVNVPPKWVREPQDVHAVLGQDLRLDCQVEGFPKPTMLWTRANGNFTTFSKQIPRKYRASISRDFQAAAPDEKNVNKTTQKFREIGACFSNC